MFIFYFKNEETREECHKALRKRAVDIGQILHEDAFTIQEIAAELEKCNKTIDALQEYKEKLYHGFVFNW